MFRIKNVSIKVKLIVYSILMISLTALIVSMALYKTSENMISEQVGNQTRISTRLIMMRTDELLRNIQKTALSLAFDTRLKSIMSKSDVYLYDYYKSIIDISKYLGNISDLNTYIGDIYIYNIKEKFYFSPLTSNVEINDKDVLYQCIIKNFSDTSRENRFKYFIWICNMSEALSDNKKEMVSLIVPIRSSSTELLGALAFNIKDNAIANIYNDVDLKLGYNFSIQDNEGIIISSTNKKVIGSNGYSFQEIESQKNSFFKIIDNKNCLVTLQKSTYNNWNYISIIPVKEMMKDTVNTLQRTILLIVLITIVMLLILSVLINNTFYKPVKHFIHNIKNSIQKKSEAIKIDRNDEIGFIFNSFCDILNENNELMKDIFNQKIFTKDAELKMLESQINPHFLYNSLDGAICMIKIKSADKAEKMLNALVKLYRTSLNNEIKIVSIGDEIENTKNYIIIQDIRYYNMISYEFRIQEEILGYKIPKLTLQHGDKKVHGNAVSEG